MQVLFKEILFGFYKFADRKKLSIFRTAFTTVPRLWEKMEEKIAAIGAQTTGLKRKLADWAKAKSPEGK